LYVLAELQVNEWLLKKKSPLQRLTRQTLSQKKSQKTKDARCKMQKETPEICVVRLYNANARHDNQH
jgi:hypothetical protein